MTGELLKEYLVFRDRIKRKLDEDQAFCDAWETINSFLKGMEVPKGSDFYGEEGYGDLEGMMRSHFDYADVLSRPSINLLRDENIEDGTDQKGCVIMRQEPDAQVDHDFALSEEASFPYIEVEGNAYVSVKILDTILDCARRGYVIDTNTTVTLDDDDPRFDRPHRMLPRHPIKRKGKKRRK